VILWELARASALVAFAAYTGVVAWGILLAGRAWRPAAPQLAFHRFLSSLGLVAVGLHVGCVLLDHYARVPLRGLIGMGVKTGIVFGAAALWLTIALPLTFKLKRAKILGNRAWRAFHYFGYAVWGLSLIHGLAVGTDAPSPYVLAGYAVSAGIVAGATWWRFVERRAEAAMAAAGASG
jgi:methionine sulfoxide reductase heme-binding subunit